MTDSEPFPAGGPGPAVPGARRPPTRGRGRWLATGLIAGAALALGGDRVWFMTGRPSARPGAAEKKEADAGRSRAAGDRAGGTDDGLEARWEALRGAFLQMAAPVTEALDRAERLRVELPAGQSRAREAQAAYENARRDRELAEENEKGDAAVAAPGELQSARTDHAAAEAVARQAQARLDDILRTRERLTERWVADGSSRDSARKAAGAMFLKDVRAAQDRSDRAKAVLKRAKDRVDRIDGFGLSKRAKELHAEVFGKRAEELARLAAWEAAKAEESRAETDRAGAGMSPGDRRLLDALARVVREAGPPPSADADPFAFLAFLDRFEDALNAVRAVAAEVHPDDLARRYASTVDRLLRAQDNLPP